MDERADYQQQENEEELLYGDEYASWLMANELVWSGDRLLQLQEDAHRFEEFLEWRVK